PGRQEELSLFKSRNIIGLDIGSHTIKIVQLQKKGGRHRLQSLALVEIPTEIQEEVDVTLRNEMLADLIKRTLKENNIRCKHVASSIAGDSVIVRYVKLPTMSEDELKNVISMEAEQYIPLAMDQVVLDFAILGEVAEEGAQKIEVLLVAVKEEIIDLHVQLLQLAGLNPVAIDVDTFALQNAFELNYGLNTGETISLINIGAKLTTINILEDGVTHLTRDVAVAGNNFTREIQREFDVTFGEAEELKRSEGKVLVETEDIMQMSIPKGEDKSTRIGEAIAPVLNKLVAEIQRSFDYYESTIRKKSISRIILSGGTARLKNLDKYLTDKFDVGVEFNDPFREIAIPEKHFDHEFVEAEAQKFNIGVGLALRQTE
ncbi:type IV pilus assembly protein PilM, partial [candidate division FCPU426 bacterium]|nr:type IV pilus assembly protein PilM [candidate division FCPU426 bacterium]